MSDLLAPNMPFHSRERTEQRLRDEIERLRAEAPVSKSQVKRIAAQSEGEWRTRAETAEREVERLRAEVEKYKVAWTEYNDRTEWVQQTAKPKELGMHRADVLRMRVESAERQLAALRERIESSPVAMLSEGPGGRGYVKAHLSRHATIEPPIGHRVRLVRED